MLGNESLKQSHSSAENIAARPSARRRFLYNGFKELPFGIKCLHLSEPSLALALESSSTSNYFINLFRLPHISSWPVPNQVIRSIALLEDPVQSKWYTRRYIPPVGPTIRRTPSDHSYPHFFGRRPGYSTDFHLFLDF